MFLNLRILTKRFFNSFSRVDHCSSIEIARVIPVFDGAALDHVCTNDQEWRIPSSYIEELNCGLFECDTSCHGSDSLSCAHAKVILDFFVSWPMCIVIE